MMKEKKILEKLSRFPQRSRSSQPSKSTARDNASVDSTVISPLKKMWRCAMCLKKNTRKILSPSFSFSQAAYLLDLVPSAG